MNLFAHLLAPLRRSVQRRRDALRRPLYRRTTVTPPPLAARPGCGVTFWVMGQEHVCTTHYVDLPRHYDRRAYATFGYEEAYR